MVRAQPPDPGAPGLDAASADPLEVDRVRRRLEARMLGAAFEPVRIGRFSVIARLGAGGMGVVYSAFDPQLDRKIALKLLPSAGDDDTSDAEHVETPVRARASEMREQLRRRTVREAQAMAKLSHPNVAQVHEVGEHEGRTFIAMELVTGDTLGDWQRSERTWREIVAMYTQAARGLAAAHAAGLVHRDFKPANAVVGVDGRLRVLDFGLVRVHEEATTGSDTEGDDEDGDTLASRLTRDGAIVGTPAYMAPEQLTGATVDARADQFALCVALWEALYRERPFPGSTRATLTESVTRGHARTPPTGSGVPAWIHAVILRGIAVDPAARFASMDALADALADDPSRRRQRRGVLVGLVALGIGALVFMQLDLRRRARDCEAGARELATAWDDATRAHVHDGMLATRVGHASASWERVEPRLDDFVRRWGEVHEQNCRAVALDSTRSAQLGQLTLGCLDDGAEQFALLVDRLGSADAQAVHRAVEAAARLPGPEHCTDDARLQRRPALPEDPDVRAEIAAVRAELIRLRNGGGEPTKPVVAPVVERAEAAGWPPLHAEALLVAGEIADTAGEYDEAARLLERAAELAMVHAHDEVAIDAIAMLVAVMGTRAEQERALWWGGMGLALARRVGDEEELRTSRLLHGIAGVELARGDFDAAQASHERGLAIETAILGEQHPEVAKSMFNLANVAFSRGDYDRARDGYARVLALMEEALGPDHPDTAKAMSNLGNALHTLGETGRAQELYERALAVREAALGPDHPEVGQTLNNLGMVLLETGDTATARRMLERAIRIKQAAFGFDHPEVANSVENLARVLATTGDFAGARELFERALRIREHALGPDHPQTAASLDNVALAVGDTGAYEEAKVLHRRALAAREKALGPDHPHVAASLGNLAINLEALGELDEAKQALQRAKGIVERSLGPDHPQLATCLTNLADIEYRLGELDGSESHQRRALEIWEKALGPDHPDVAFALVGLGNVHSDRGDLSTAAKEYERALAIREAALGPDHVDVALTLNNLAGAFRDLRDYDAAKRHYERALSIWERALGPENAELGFALVGLAEVALAQKRWDEALVLAERAMALRDRVEAGAAERGDTRIVLARALWESGGSRKRALALAKQARRELASVGIAKQAAVAQADAWIAAHAG